MKKTTNKSKANDGVYVVKLRVHITMENDKTRPVEEMGTEARDQVVEALQEAGIPAWVDLEGVEIPED